MATATKSRKYRFATRLAAEEAQHKASQDAHCSMVCLTELANGNVHWIKRGHYWAGVIRPDSPTGGYLLIRYFDRSNKCDRQPSFAAYYLDHWTNDTKRRYETIGAHDQDELDLRQLAYDVYAYRNEAAGYPQR
jgi:hypothetical protein